MVEPLSVFTLSLSVVLHVTEVHLILKSVADRFRRGLHDYSSELDRRDVELQSGANVQKIKGWQKLWLWDDDQGEEFFKTLWGHAGWEKVSELLQTILGDCKELKIFALDLVQLADDIVKKNNVRRPKRWQSLPKWLRTTVKLQIDKAEGKEIRRKLDALSENIDNLWALSEHFYRSIHQISSGKLHATGDEVPQPVLQQALESRQAATALYWYCQSHDIDMDLDMDLFRKTRDLGQLVDVVTDSDLKISYHFVYKSPSTMAPRDIFVKPLRMSDSVQNDIHAQDDDDEDQGIALRVALVTTQSRFVRLAPSEKASEAYFYIKSAPSTSLSDPHPEILAELFRRPQNHQPLALAGRFSLVEKIALAYRVVECGLFLLGTPWLSHLSSDALRRCTNKSLDYQYSLYVPGDAKRQLQSSSALSLESRQIFLIGVLLIEIALETSLSPSNARSLESESHSISSVEKAMGFRYKSACEFCLNYTTPSRDRPEPQRTVSMDLRQNDDVSTLTIMQYYEEVFIRLQDVQKSL